MKHRHKLQRIATSVLSLVLCGAMALGGPAFAAQGEELPTPAVSSGDSTQLAPSPSPAPAAPSNTEDTKEPGTSPSPSASPNPSASPDPSASPSPSPSPEVTRYTVTFQMGSFGTVTVEVEDGECPDEVPEIPEKHAAKVLGWFDQEGNQVDPSRLTVTADVTYTARWGREVEDLLDTEDHSAYISGYDTGMFLPDKTVTRAEAATMFYKLLRSQNWEKQSFPDVKAGQWYAQAVETLAGLGGISGYEDGTFGPDKKITRAEFVTIAMAFSTLQEGENPFPDVGENFWATPFIVSAVSQGWISGFENGTFAPNDPVTRAQAVSIINKMLGRQAPENVKGLNDVKNFYDLFATHWAYGAIVEASTTHTYHQSPQGEQTVETWDSYEKDTTQVESHWVSENGALYYVDGAARKVVRGAATINGVKYLFGSSGAAFTGFAMDGEWRRYYRNGLMVEDISGLGVVSGPYYIKVYKPANYLVIFAKDPATGAYNTPVRAMLVSCGVSTPTGTYYTPARYRWLKMVGDTWAQWCTQIEGNYLFHSVPNWTKNNKDLEVDEYNKLGQTRSLGCIRLCCRDAKWIYDNCQIGTQVYISGTETSGPLGKPTGIQLPSWHTWDPTDPTAYAYCDQHGCHQDLH